MGEVNKINKYLWQKYYFRFFSFLARERIKNQDIDLRKIHVHNAIVCTTAPLMWAYAVLAHLTINSPVPGVVGYVCSLVHLLSPLLFLITKDIFIVASFCIAPGMIHQGVFSWYSGGYTSNVLIWYGILPFLAGMTIGKKGAIFWFVLTVLVSVLYMTFHLKGMSIPSQISETGGYLAQGLIVFGWITLSTILIIILTNLYDSKEKLLNDQANKIDDLFRVLFHDLSNPLGRISIGVNLSKKTLDPQLLDKSLSIISQATDSMLDITQNIRKIYSVTKGKTSFALEECKINAAIEYVLGLNKAEIDKKNLTVQYDFERHSDRVVMVDEMSFKNQVLGNILSNAIKFSPPGGTIRIDIYPAGEETIRIEITDDGAGMPQCILEGLFDINKKTSRPGTLGETGTGFGMSIMKSFMDLYKGNVEVVTHEQNDKKIKSGTTFKLTLRGK